MPCRRRSERRLVPAIWSRFIRHSAMKCPTCRLSAVGIEANVKVALPALISSSDLPFQALVIWRSGPVVSVSSNTVAFLSLFPEGTKSPPETIFPEGRCFHRGTTSIYQSESRPDLKDAVTGVPELPTHDGFRKPAPKCILCGDVPRSTNPRALCAGTNADTSLALRIS